MKFALILLTMLLVASPCMAEYAPSTDQVLNAYIQGCLAQDFSGPIEIQSDVLPAIGTLPATTTLMITVTKDTDVKYRPFEVYEIANDLKDIGGKVPNLFSVNCRIEDSSGREIASLDWDLM